MAKSKQKVLSPGALVVGRFNAAGVSCRQLAGLVDRDHSRIVRLTKPRPGGTGGRIPSELQAPLLRAAWAARVVLTADELIHGGPL